MSTHTRLVKLLNKGDKVFDSVSGKYYHKDETNQDDKGGRVLKSHDVFISNENVNRSKFKKGYGWQRGIR